MCIFYKVRLIADFIRIKNDLTSKEKEIMTLKKVV